MRAATLTLLAALLTAATPALAGRAVTNPNRDFPAKNAFVECLWGNVPGCDWVFKFGENPSIAAPIEVIWDGGGIYTAYPTTPTTLDCASTVANDAVGGTGATSIRVAGLGPDWELQEAEFVPTGVTPVALSKTWLRLFRMQTLTAGTTETNVGTIFCEDATTGDNVASTDDFTQIRPGMGSTLMAVYTVPACKGMILADITVSVGKGQDSHVSAETRSVDVGVFPDGAWRTILTWDVYESGSAPLENAFVLIPPRTDIRFKATTGGAGVPVHANFMGYMYDIPGCTPPGP